MNTDTAEQPDVRRARVARTWWLGGLALVGLYVALLLAGGEAADLAGAGIEVLPFVALALLAYAGTRSRPARLGAWTVLALLTLGAAALAVGQVVDAAPDERDRAAAAVIGVTIGLIVGWGFALRRARAAIGRALPIDPDSFVHMVALIAVVSLTLVMLVPLVVLGEPPLLLQLERDGAPETDPSLLDDLYGLFWLVPAAVVAVGFPLVRGWRGALTRLGLVRPTLRQIAFALAASVALVVAIIALDQLITRVWEAFGWAETYTETFDELIAYALNPLGALVIGVTAGLGEELAVRGVLQPRLGILLPNLFFAALHALQYNFDGLLSVFLVGLILGLIRRRTNTSTSAIVHGAYDFWLIMLTVVTA